MKNAIRMAGLGAAILTGLATHTLAAGSDASGRHDGPRHAFEDLDANSDGLITRDEMQAHMQARFAATDTDGDGKLTRQELSAKIEAHQRQRRDRRLDKMISMRDADGDGALSLEEMRSGRGDRMFARIDADGDGAVSKAEFEEMQNKHRARHGNFVKRGTNAQE